MKKMKAAFIGFLPEAGDVYQTLEDYAKIGYRAFEGGDLLFEKGDPAENLKRVEAIGMKPLAVSCNFLQDQAPDPKEILRKVKKIGVSMAVCYCGRAGAYRFGGTDRQPTCDELMKECEAMDSVAKELEKEGVSLAFHNHDAEFSVMVRGVPAHYLMAANTQYLKFELDTGWADFGGYNPVSIMKELGDRLAMVHIKDYVPAVTTERPQAPDGRHIVVPVFTSPGTGELDLQGCLETAQALGIEYATVEQDTLNNLSWRQALQAGYLNMRETGIVE